MSDRDVARLRALHAEGSHTQESLAADFGVSRSYVSRLLAGGRRLGPVAVAGPEIAAAPPPAAPGARAVGQVEAALVAMFPGEVSGAGGARLQAALVAARKLDELAVGDSVAEAAVVPRLVSVLMDVIEKLDQGTGSAAAEVARILKPLQGGKGA